MIEVPGTTREGFAASYVRTFVDRFTIIVVVILSSLSSVLPIQIGNNDPVLVGEYYNSLYSAALIVSAGCATGLLPVDEPAADVNFLCRFAGSARGVTCACARFF